jgi:hypothetical protein
VAQGVRSPDRRSGRSGNAQPQVWRWWVLLLWPPTSSKSVPVEHWRQARRNRDASLYSGGCDSGAFVGRAQTGRGDCADSAERPRASWPGVRPESSRLRSKSVRGHNGGKQLPAPGNWRKQRGGLTPASAIPVNADAISTGLTGRAILCWHRTPSCACWARHGIGPGSLGRCRACFFGGKPSSTASRLLRHPFLKRAAPGASALALRAPFDAPDTAHRCRQQQALNCSAEQESFRISDRRRHLVSDSDRRSHLAEFEAVGVSS